MQSKKTHTTPLDAQWFMQFEPLGTFQAHQYFANVKGGLSTLKKSFLSDEIENPHFEYLDINATDLDLKEKALLDLKKELLKDEKNEVVRSAYEWKIDEKLTELSLLQAVAGNDMETFQKTNESLYGSPSPDLFAHGLHVIHSEIQTAQNSHHSDLMQVATHLKEKRPPAPSTKPEITLPSKTRIENVKVYVQKQLQFLLAEVYETLQKAIQAKKIYSNIELKALFQTILERLKASDWAIVAHPPEGKPIFVLDQSKKTIHIPDKIYPAQRVLELVAHEMGVHLTRRLRGDQASLQLLSIGLDRYIRGDEGLAATLEDAIKPELHDFFGLDRYLAISLALGLDGKKRSFRQVFEIMKSFHLFKGWQANLPSEKIYEDAQEKAWMNAYRTFRGTNGQQAGFCYTKDKLYREGNVGVWNLLSNFPSSKLEAQIETLLLGKYDPLNARHQWVMEQLG